MGTWKCGTKACAIGHALNLPEFKETGLRLEHQSIYGVRNLYPRLGNYWYCAAVGKALNIDECDAEQLFCPDDNADETPTEVADRIDQWCDEREGRG